MAKDWPEISDKAAFCAWLTHQRTGKWPIEKAASSPAAFALSVPVVKWGNDGTVTGWAATSTVNDVPVIDHQGDWIPVDELESASHALMVDGGRDAAGEMHARRVGDIVESFVVTKAKARALGFNADREGWIVTMKIHDPQTRARIDAGELIELSIHGKSRKILLGKRGGGDAFGLYDLSVDEVSVVDRGASGNGAVAPSIVIAKRHVTKEQGMSLEEILAKLSQEEQQVVLAAIEAAKTPAQPAPAPAPEPPQAPQPIAAAMPQPEDQQKDLPAEVKKQLDELAEVKKQMAAMQDAAKLKEFIAKAKERLAFLPGFTAEQGGALLKAASENLPEDTFNAIEKALCAASEAVSKSNLFQDKGHQHNPPPADAMGEVRKRAREIADKRGITESRAVSLMMDDPEYADLMERAQRRGE